MGRVLIVNPHYFPGWRSGGPQRTIKNICDAFGDTNDIFILTLNYDMGESQKYDLPTNEWVEYENVKVKYLSAFLFKNLKDEYEKFDIVYTCGLFCQNTRILLSINKKNFRKGKKFYVAPMGVFSEKAIQSKALKKKAFLLLCKISGLFKNIIWSFTSEIEKEDAIKSIGKKHVKNFIIAEDMPRKFDLKKQLQAVSEKKMGKALRVIFLSRICAKKNLFQCIEILKTITDKNIVFDIYGVKEDLTYWKKCEHAIAELPANIHTAYCGEVLPEKVLDTFAAYDVFLFPTKGENYGHVIYEALAAGCIPVISDLTPWQDLAEKNCGFVCKFEDLKEYAAAIYKLASLDKAAFKELSFNAISYAANKYSEACATSNYLKIFNS